MDLKNAGGTNGGTGSFLIGCIMMIAGGYLFLRSIIVSNNFSFGGGLYSIGGFNLTTGMILVPFVFGIGMIFFNSRSILGWALTLASLIMLLFGVVSSIEMRLMRMSAFELFLILVLLIGGIGLFLRSIKDIRGYF